MRKTTWLNMTTKPRRGLYFIMATEGEKKCSFFLKGKGRYCRLSAAGGTPFCGEHMLSGGVKCLEDSDKRRIICPLDPSHTIYEHLIDKHLLKCNAAKKIKPNCYSYNINSGLCDYVPSHEEKLTLSEFSETKIAELLGRIDDSLAKLNENIQTMILDHPVMKDELANDSNGPTALKHLQQQSSIIGHLDSSNLLSSQTHYIEFGAGRGKLSHWLQLALQGDDSVHFTLVDRANCRRKFDLYHRFESQGPKFERLLIDIEHLDLGLLLKDGGRVTYNQVVGISKHLCGAATDLALRCLTRYQQSVNGSSSVANMAPAVQGMVMALCCHQRCNWKSMFGREILEDFGFNPVDFHIISHMTSWAVCGQRPDKVDKDDASPPVGYIPHVKEHIGLKCKRFMDLIRVHKLRQCGYDCHLVHYVDRTISLENVLLIAVLKDCSNTYR